MEKAQRLLRAAARSFASGRATQYAMHAKQGEAKQSKATQSKAQQSKDNNWRLCRGPFGGRGGLPAKAEWLERRKGWPRKWRRLSFPGSLPCKRAKSETQGAMRTANRAKRIKATQRKESKATQSRAEQSEESFNLFYAWAPSGVRGGLPAKAEWQERRKGWPRKWRRLSFPGSLPYERACC